MVGTSRLYTMLIPGKLVVISYNISCDKSQNLNIALILGLLCYQTKDCRYFTWIGKQGPKSHLYKKCHLKNAIPNGITNLVGATSGDKNCRKKGK